MHQSTTQRKRRAIPRDARSLARLLIDTFGERGPAYAVHQSLKARSRGDLREAARWRWIAEVTRETLRLDIDAMAERPEE